MVKFSDCQKLIVFPTEQTSSAQDMKKVVCENDKFCTN